MQSCALHRRVQGLCNNNSLQSFVLRAWAKERFARALQNVELSAAVCTSLRLREKLGGYAPINNDSFVTPDLAKFINFVDTKMHGITSIEFRYKNYSPTIGLSCIPPRFAEGVSKKLID